MRRRRLLALAGLAWLTAGSPAFADTEASGARAASADTEASGAPAASADTEASGAPAASGALLVLPLNVLAGMPPELTESSPAVWEELASYLQSRGRQLKTARPEDARRLWYDSIRQLRSEEAIESIEDTEALRVLVANLARYAEFSAVIVPSLVVRQVPIRGRRAEWDGISVAVELRADSRETRRLGLLMRLEGLAPGASLHLLVLDEQGRVVHEAIRGLELMAAVRVVEDPDEPFVYESREDLFRDREVVRRQVARALAPFVPLPAGERD